MKRIQSMKYSFRLLNIGPKSEFRNYWGYPCNLLVCPRCKPIKHEPQKKYIKSGPSLHLAKTPVSDPVLASMPSAIGATASKNSANKKSAAIRQNPAAATMASRQFDGRNIQRRQNWTWGLPLLLILLATMGVLVFSLIQPPSVSLKAANKAGERRLPDNTPGTHQRLEHLAQGFPPPHSCDSANERHTFFQRHIEVCVRDRAAPLIETGHALHR